MANDLRRRDAIVLLGGVALAWGTSWPVTKALLDHLSPLWATAIRSMVALVGLFAMAAVGRRLVLPQRGDVPVILNIALLHMVAFTALVTIGLQFVPVGRSVVLAYTTPLWVMVGGRLLLGEPLTPARVIGVMSGVAGLLLLFNPAAFNWDDRNAVIGNALVLLAALCWAASILHVRAHQWVSSPFELAPWEVLLATGVLTVLAALFEGMPQVEWNARLVLLLLYGGFIGIAFPYWASVSVNRSLPAITTSLGLLGVPVVGVLCSVVAFGEPIGVSLVLSMALIIGGIAVSITGATVQRSKGQ